MNYHLVKMLENQQGQDASSISTYEDKDEAQVAYHNILAAYHNAEDVLYAIVQIVNEWGNVEIMEIVDHRPEPEPPEPVTIVSITKEGNVYTITYSDGTVQTFVEPDEG